MDENEWEERTEAITDRLSIAEANIEALEEQNARLLAENVDLESRVTDLESEAAGLADLKELVRKLQWCVENGIRG